MRLGAGAPACEELSAPCKKSLARIRDSTYVANCPISHVPVAACRSVGIRTRGRTAARDMGPLLGDGHPRGKDPGASRVSNNDRQPEAKPANPALHGGRSLKQRRNGLFWSQPVSKS